MWKIFKEKYENFGGADDWAGFIAIIFFLSIIGLSAAAVFSDKRVECYYLYSTYTSVGPAYQIKSSINWSEDKVAFSSADHKETLAVYAQLNQCGSDNIKPEIEDND